MNKPKTNYAMFSVGATDIDNVLLMRHFHM